MKELPNRQASVDSRRIALEREVSLRFPAFDTFITECSANISTTGMFVVSEDPQPPGSRFSFEFSIADDWKLIRGTGEVVWSRRTADGPDRPPGMGVRFVELDPQSRRLIRWIVEKHVREGGKPFELDELRSVVDQVIGEAIERPTNGTRPARPSEPPRRTRETPATPAPRRRSIAGWIGAVAVGAVIVGLFWLSELAPQLGDGAAPTQRSARATSPPPREQPVEPAPTESSVPVEPDLDAVSGMIASWSQAWSQQRVDDYLAHYSRDFRPPDGLSREAWRSQRTDRITRPDFIQVAVSRLQTTLEGEGRAVARFYQGYRSNTYSDEVLKELELAWEAGEWKIVAERTPS